MSAARVFTAFLVARAAFGLVFLAESLGRLPLVLYFPIERRVALGVPGQVGSGLEMAWFGATGGALLAAVVFGGIAWFVSGHGRLARWLGQPQVMLAIARAGGLVLLVDLAYFGWMMMHQTPAPLPIQGDLPMLDHAHLIWQLWRTPRKIFVIS